MKTKTCAAITVAYFPDANFYTNAAKIASRVSISIIFDNTDLQDQQVKISLLPKNCYLIKKGGNIGIGKALNESIQYLNQKYNYDYIFTFDQDTTINNTFIEKMVENYGKLPNISNVIMTVPTIYDKNTNSNIGLFKNTKASKSLEFKKVLLSITSGSMISNEVFKKAHIKFREDFFIDHVDHDFCLKAHEKSYEIYQNENISIQHELGEKFSKKMFFSEISFQEHSALRLYYFTRNGLILTKEHFKNKQFVKYFISNLFKKILKIILFEKHKLKKLQYIFKGIRHFLVHRLGKIDD